MTLLVNEGIMLVVATLLQDVFWSVLTLLCLHVSSILTLTKVRCCPTNNLCFNYLCMCMPFQVVLMLSAGFFRIRNALPGPVWMYPMSYIAFHTYSIQVFDDRLLLRIPHEMRYDFKKSL